MAIFDHRVDWTSAASHVLLNPRWPTEDGERLADLGSAVLRAHVTEPSLVLASSGTSAGSWREIKMILLKKKSILAAATSIISHFQITAKDRLAQTLPDFHIGGLGTGARAFLSGAAMVDFREPGWQAQSFLQRAKQDPVTIVSLVPTQLFDLVAAQLKPWPDLRIVFIGGAELSRDLEDQARALGWPLVVTYGMTETSAMIAAREEANPELGFKALPGVQWDLDGITGKLKLKATSLADGFARADTSGLTWSPLVNSEDWFVTEDQGQRGPSGRFFVLGRERDQIKINGENVNLSTLRHSLESILRERSMKIQDFHLTGVPDPRSGHRIVLFAASQGDLNELQRQYNQRVLPFERIQEIFPVSEIPRTDLGKVRDQRLVEKALAKGIK